jgi:signal peptidase II
MKSTGSLLIKAAGVAAATLAADQAIKVWIRHLLASCTGPTLADCPNLHLFGPLGLVRLENAGSDLGFYPGLAIWIVVAAVGLLLVPLYGRRLNRGGLGAIWALGLQTGGALGNLWDRLAYGSATDYLDVGIGLIFNLADIALLMGALLAILLLAHPRSRTTQAMGPQVTPSIQSIAEYKQA